MTFWAKLLTVVIFVLSIVFASMSTVLFAKREDYRDKLIKETAQKEQVAADAKATKSKLEAQLKDADGRIADMTAKRDALQLQSDTLTHELDQSNGKLKQTEITLQSSLDNNLALTNQNKEMDAKLIDMATTREALEKEKDEDFAQMTAERKRANELEKQNVDLKSNLEATATKLQDAQDTIKLNEDTFAELARHNIEAREIISGLTAVPEIKGKVALVDPSTNTVILNVGRKDGVKKNYEFTIYRGSQFIAKVDVYNTEDNQCAAQIVTTSHLPIQRGDNAATRLIGQ